MADVKPLTSTDDISDKNLLATPGPGAGKLKQSRYEDVWPEDVHAAFMEAVALYPPMGKRRLKYYRVSAHENDQFLDNNRTKSFGRCQLIQSYIMEKTGKNRSRKQVSSHLQRLKKIHKDNPAMQPLFSERSQPPVEHCPASQAIAIPSQDIFANISFSARHLKSDFDLTVNLQNTGTGNAFPYASEASIFDGGSCNVPDLSADLHNQPSIFSPQEFPIATAQQFSTSISHPSHNGYIPELPEPSPIRDVINGGSQAGTAFNTSAFSISMRRLASRLPVQTRVDSCPTTHFSRALHIPAFQQTHQWISHDSLVDDTPYHSLLAPAQQLLHTPFHPLQLFPPEKQQLDPDLAPSWMWPQNSDTVFGLRGATLSETPYSPTLNQSNLTYPERAIDSPGFHSSPSESDVSQLPQGFPPSYVATGNATVSESVSMVNLPGQAVQASPEGLASPPVVRPTPVYPVTYVHSQHAHAPPSIILS